MKKKSSGPTIGQPSKRSLQLFFMACYDLDRFRAFVASEGFADVYDVPAGEREAGKRQARDADLMDTAHDGRNNRLVRHPAHARGDGTGQ